MTPTGPVDQGASKPDDPAQRGDDRPEIDVSDALGAGGHEVEQLGYEGVPDTGPVLREHSESQVDEEIEIDRTANEFPPD
jgi:hypothetical protein